MKNVSLNRGIDFRIENARNEINQCRIMITSIDFYLLLNSFVYNIYLFFIAPSGKKVNPAIGHLADHFNVSFKPFEVG